MNRTMLSRRESGTRHSEWEVLVPFHTDHAAR